LQKELKSKMMLINTSNMDETVAQILKENVLILGNTQNLFIDKKEILAINLFNGEHITIVSAVEGYDKKVVQTALSLEKHLSNKINFAFTDEFGYLMSDITRIGAGLKLEANIMLSAIKSINKIEQVKQNVAKLGFSLNETKFPAVYTLSTNCNLGIGENQIISDFENTLKKLQELETESVKMLDVSKHDEIVDKSQRSMAILNAAHMLNYDELYNMIVNLRIGLNLGLVQIELKTLNKLQKLLIKKTNDYVSPSELKDLATKVKQILKGGENV